MADEEGSQTFRRELTELADFFDEKAATLDPTEGAEPFTMPEQATDTRPRNARLKGAAVKSKPS